MKEKTTHTRFDIVLFSILIILLCVSFGYSFYRQFIEIKPQNNIHLVPTNTVLPTITKYILSPTQIIVPSSKTSSSCLSDSDCLLKEKAYCCIEKLQYYMECIEKDKIFPAVSCFDNTTCIELKKPTQCICKDGKCVGL